MRVTFQFAFLARYLKYSCQIKLQNHEKLEKYRIDFGNSSTYQFKQQSAVLLHIIRICPGLASSKVRASYITRPLLRLRHRACEALLQKRKSQLQCITTQKRVVCRAQVRSTWSYLQDDQAQDTLSFDLLIMRAAISLLFQFKTKNCHNINWLSNKIFDHISLHLKFPGSIQSTKLPQFSV